MEVIERKRREDAEKKMRARSELIRKIMEENERRLFIENEVAQMEREELELIQRLQNTQLAQKTAYDDLENALSSGSKNG